MKFKHIIFASYDYNESVRTFDTEQALLNAVAADFEIEQEACDSTEFWEACTDAYENDNWKAYTACRINTDTGEVHTFGQQKQGT
jgi:hypothetical protein